MKKLKFIFLPIGAHDIAGNKRLKNLSKYLLLNHQAEVVFLYPLADKLLIRSKPLFILIKFLSLFIDIFRIVFVLIKEKAKDSSNYLYFYEGRHLMIHRIAVAKLLGYKILIDLVEDPNPLSYSKSITHKLRVIYFLGIYKLIPIFANGIIVVTKYLKYKIENDFNETVPVFLLTVTFDPDDFRKPSKPFPFPSIFYGGSYGDNYDFDSLFMAFNNLIPEYPELRLVLSGKIENEMAKKINEKILEPENILFLGFLSEDEYYYTICGMNILCMPRNNSLHANAGFPFKLAEYLATGNPVITSRVSDVSDYLEDDEAFIYEPLDYKKIEFYIRYILSNPEEASRTGERGKLRAGKLFAADSVERDFVEFISFITK
jgi:glycosyltransferase involved in cell wall biosynthesis